MLACLDADESHCADCDKLVPAGGHGVCRHPLAETVSTLTGGRQRRRLSAALAALRKCERRGERGAAVYDWLHWSQRAIASTRRTIPA